MTQGQFLNDSIYKKEIGSTNLSQAKGAYRPKRFIKVDYLFPLGEKGV